MKQLQERAVTPSVRSGRDGELGGRISKPLAVWQLNLLRVGYLVMGGGLVVFKWPLLFRSEPWGLAEGTVQCLLVAMSVLALLGVRYPVKMLPVLLFEVAWKLLWLGYIALPLWMDDKLDGATLDQIGKLLWVMIIIAVIPWRFVAARFVRAAGDPWRTGR